MTTKAKIADLAKRATGFADAGNGLMRFGLDKHAFQSARLAYQYADQLAAEAVKLAPKSSVPSPLAYRRVGRKIKA